LKQPQANEKINNFDIFVKNKKQKPKTIISQSLLIIKH